MSPVASPELQSRSAPAAPDTEQSDGFDELIAEHPELHDLKDIDVQAAAVQDVEQAVRDVDSEVKAAEAPAHVKNRINGVEEELAAPPPTTAKTPPPTPFVPAVPPPVEGEPNNDDPETLVVVGRDADAERAARAYADHQLSVELSQGGRFKRAVRALWKAGPAREFYRQKYIREAKEQIASEQDVMLFESSDKRERSAATTSILERFRAGEFFVDKDIGEQHKELGDESQLARDIKDIVYLAAKEGWTKDQIDARYQEVIAADQAGAKELSGAETVTSMNVHQIVESLRGKSMHEDALADAVGNMRIVAGESRSGGTEANYNAADRAIEWLGKRKVLGRIVPDAVASAGISIAFGVGVAGRGTAAAIAGVTVPGVVGGAIGAWREAKRAKDEIAQTRRDHEEGKIIDGTDKPRWVLFSGYEKAVYDTRLAPEITDALNRLTDDKTLDEGGDEALKEALSQLAEAQVLREYTYNPDENQRKSLLRYSDPLKKDEEKLALRTAELAAHKAIKSRLDDATRERLGIPLNANDQDIFESYKEEFYEAVEADVAEKDQAARKIILGRAAVGAAKGAAMSAVLSFGAQQAADLVFDSGGSHVPETSSNTNGNMVSQGHDLSISEGNSITVDEQASTVTIKGPDGQPINGLENLPRNEDGTFPPDSIDKIKTANLEISDPRVIPAEYETKIVPIDQYIKDNPTEFQKLEISWLDNNTPTVYDLNEQGGRLLQGPDGTVIIEQSMTPTGSYNSEVVADMTNRQNNVFDMAFKQPDGTFLHKTFAYGDPIPKPWADMLYEKPDGTWGFKGDGHVSWGKLGGDTFYSAASVPGDGQPLEIPQEVLKTPERTGYDITVPSAAEHAGVEGVPALVWAPGRRGPAVAERRRGGDYYGGYELSDSQRAKFLKEISPRLRENPQGRLEPKKELAWYRNDIREKKGAEYLSEIDRLIENTPELRSIDRSTKAIVNIPVHAPQEQDNIYHTLSQYDRQTNGGKEQSVILLHVNWFDDEESDSQKAAAIEKTKQEIARAKRDFPSLNIAVIESRWEKDKRDRGEYGDGIIGHVARKMYDTSMMAVQKAMAEGRMPDDHEVLMIRNDSDAQKIDPRMVSQMIKYMDQNPDKDAFTGAIRWGSDRYDDLPGFALASNLREVMHIATRRRGVSQWTPTVGINTAARMSTLAAVGGIGSDPESTGIGTDDYSIGGRIKDARQPIPLRRPALKTLLYNPRSYREYRRSRRNLYGRPSVPTTEDFSRHQHVPGATIDTDPGRLESAYLDPAVESTSDAWSNWGSKNRGEGLEALRKKYTEDLKNNPDAVFDHLEKDFSKSFTDRYRDPAHIAAGLAMLFPVSIQGRPAYNLTWDNKGKAHFTFTPEGKNWTLRAMKKQQQKARSRKAAQAAA